MEGVAQQWAGCGGVTLVGAGGRCHLSWGSPRSAERPPGVQHHWITVFHTL